MLRGPQPDERQLQFSGHGRGHTRWRQPSLPEGSTTRASAEGNSQVAVPRSHSTLCFARRSGFGKEGTKGICPPLWTRRRRQTEEHPSVRILTLAGFRQFSQDPACGVRGEPEAPRSRPGRQTRPPRKSRFPRASRLRIGRDALFCRAPHKPISLTEAKVPLRPPYLNNISGEVPVLPQLQAKRPARGLTGKPLRPRNQSVLKADRVQP